MRKTFREDNIYNHVHVPIYNRNMGTWQVGLHTYTQLLQGNEDFFVNEVTDRAFTDIPAMFKSLGSTLLSKCDLDISVPKLTLTSGTFCPSRPSRQPRGFFFAFDHHIILDINTLTYYSFDYFVRIYRHEVAHVIHAYKNTKDFMHSSISHSPAFFKICKEVGGAIGPSRL